MIITESSEKKPNINRSLVTFRKAPKEVNNSLIILQKHDVNYSLNVDNNENFFNKKNVNKNINKLKQTIPKLSIKKNILPLDLKKMNINLTKIENKDLLVSKKDKSEKSLVRQESLENFNKVMKSEEEEDNKYMTKDVEIYLNDKVLPKKIKKKEEKIEDDQILCIGENYNKDNYSEKSFDYVENLTKTVNNNLQEYVNKATTNEIPYSICLFCDNYYIRGNTLSASCGHMFCMKCGKNFYEEKIEEGENQLKCPVYKCNFFINHEILRTLVTNKHWENFDKTIRREVNNKQTHNAININSSIKALNINDFSSPKQNSDMKMKMYSQRHVFDITNNDSFRYFSKSKEQYCGRCYEPSLFGKNGRKTVKCLNCWFNSCKFCGKESSDEHFNLTSFNYCKVFYRKKMIFQPSNRTSIIKEILIGIVLFIVGYFVFIFGLFKYISNFFCTILGIPYDENINKKAEAIGKSNYLLITIYSILMIISICLLLPIFLLLFPYFPLLVFLWN